MAKKNIRQYEIFNEEYYNNLTFSQKKEYLLNVLKQLSEVRGKKITILNKEDKISVAKSVRNKYLKYYNMLQKLNNDSDISINLKKCDNKVRKVEKNRMKLRTLFSRFKATIVMGMFYITSVFGSPNLSQNTQDNDMIASIELEQEDINADIESDEEIEFNEKCESNNVNNDEINNNESVTYLNSSQYFDIECPDYLQDYIFELSNQYHIPSAIAFTIIEKESGGTWATNGVVSVTDDYGLAQINKCNFKYIESCLGYNAYEIQNDVYKNVDAMFLLLGNIFNQYNYTEDNYDLLNVCGTYNGWVNWNTIESSTKYAYDCVNIYNEKFAKDDDSLGYGYVKTYNRN